MKFESIEPAHCTFPFPGKFLEGFMLFFSFDMAASDRSRIDKRDTGALSQDSHFKEDSKRNTYFPLQLYKSIVGYGMWKILLHMCSNEEIEMLQIPKRGGVKEDKDRHHLTIWYGEFAVSPFFGGTFFQGMTFDYSVVFFEEFVEEVVDLYSFISGNRCVVCSLLSAT